MVVEDVMRFKVDLRRVAYWLLQGGYVSAKKTLSRAKERYDLDGLCPGGREMEWWWKEMAGADHKKAAERAMTLSVVLR